MKLASGTALFDEETGSTARASGLTDYVLVTVEKNTKNDLAEKIEEAQAVLDSTPKASQSKKNALKKAIDDAKAVLADDTTDDDGYTAAVKALDTAIAAFKRNDTTSGGSGGRGTTYVNITLRTEGKGKAMLSATRIPKGTSVTVTAVPDKDYAVSNVLVGGVSVGSDEVTTIASVTSDTEIVVVFKEKGAADDGLPFIDVHKSDWFYDYVKYVYEKGLFKGVTPTLFAPDDNLTRAMLVTVLYRAEGSPEMTKPSGFEDVAADTYYAAAVAWAAENGIVYGVSETLFEPETNITREQIAAILYRYASFKGYDVTVGEDTNILSYEDFAEISEYAIEPLAWTAGTGILAGRTASTLDPQENATRAEAATVLKRLFELNK